MGGLEVRSEWGDMRQWSRRWGGAGGGGAIE